MCVMLILRVVLYCTSGQFIHCCLGRSCTNVLVFLIFGMGCDLVMC